MEEHAILNKKEEIIDHYEQSLTWVHSLTDMTDENWRLPISPGKWSVAEVIRHLVAWDKFVLNERLPYIFTQQKMPVAPNSEVINAQAAIQARDEEKSDTIESFCDTRRLLLQAISHFEVEEFTQDVHMRSRTITLYDYFIELKEHDDHHINQIKELLEIPPE
ncbi:DinB family protein [Halobacillus rhizosphaerae]|uniref:DinB family protein n=1 Tax=Halobacillus rhizosphaerae TaxID=3064889 RepID=UPI00398AF28D